MTTLRVYLIGGLLLIMAVMSGVIVKLQTEKKLAEEVAIAAKAQTVISEGTAQAVDRLVIKERTITQEVENVIREIDALPNSEALVPDDVSIAWGNGIDGLRHDTGKPDSDGAGKSEALPKD